MLVFRNLIFCSMKFNVFKRLFFYIIYINGVQDHPIANIKLVFGPWHTDNIICKICCKTQFSFKKAVDVPMENYWNR